MQSKHSSHVARQRAMLDLVASHGYLMGHSPGREQQRQALLDTAEQARDLKRAGLPRGKSGSPLARMRCGVGFGLIRVGLWLHGSAPARQTFQV
jgi:hypothetical protein